MPTTNDNEFDYQAYMRHHPPECDQLQRGVEAREQRRDMAKSKITIRIDSDILDQFKEMVPDGQGYQRLMNQALREWLEAQGIKGSLRRFLRI
ncbi:MAG: hypothetical protein ETSY1_29400 [Candidatus Entotheonella factor]|uniref:CopG family transcriptional regulator n=1 Tax=Entotheonella factor TaxID=1429438 RepID=W4LCC5_ENTF1|nr:MAG: hypothetical protein ETSY1_29400 [Candidatus Entotheonella factor]